MTLTLLWLAGLTGCATHDPTDSGKVTGITDPDQSDTDTDADSDTDADGDTDTDTDTDTTTDERQELAFSLGATDAEPDQAVAISAVVMEGGSPTSEVVELSVSPAGATIASDSGSVSAADDGVYTVTARYLSLTQSASFTVDHNGPALTVDSPGAATWVAAGSAPLTLSGADNLHTVGDVTVDSTVVGSGGGVTTPVGLAEGLNILSASAVDTDPHEGPNTADVAIGVIAGDTSPLEDALADSIEARLSTAALNSLAGSLLGSIDAASLEATLIANNPIVETSFSCVAIDVDVTSLSFGTASLALTPSTSGVQIQIDIPDLVIDFNAVADVCYGGTLTYPGSISASNVEIVSDLSFAVPTPGDVEVTASTPEVTFTDFVTDFGNLDDTLSAFGTSLEELGIDVEPLLADAIADAVTGDVPSALESALEAISVDQSFEALGATLTIEALISGIVTDAQGLTLQLQSNLSSDTTSSTTPENPGSLLLSGAAPDYAASTSDVSLSLSLDVMNRMLHLAWEAGAFDLSYPDYDDAAAITLLGTLYPGLTSIDISAHPLLPPVLTPGDDASPFYLSLGELQVTLDGTVDGADENLANLRAFLTADMAVSVADGQLVLAASSAEALADTIVVDPNAVADGETLESLVGIVAGTLATDLFPSVAMDLPSLGGLGMSATGVDATGSNGTWISVNGALE